MLRTWGILSGMFLLSWSAAAADFQCRGILRKVSDRAPMQEEIIELARTLDGAGSIRHEGELKGLAFTATLDRRDDEVLLSITKAPTYENGVITRAKLSDGRASLSQTELAPLQNGEHRPTAFFVYRLECFTR